MLEMKGIESALSEPDRARLRLLRLQLEKVGQTLHHVAWELRPASIDELGLEYALANYISEWGDQYGIAADFYSRDLKLDELTEEICTTVYRVVQEALNNIIKHARPATGVSVIMDRVNGELRLVIEDNGRGFDTSSSIAHRGSRNGGLGLAGMRERLSLIGGEFEVEFRSAPEPQFSRAFRSNGKDSAVTARVRIAWYATSASIAPGWH